MDYHLDLLPVSRFNLNWTWLGYEILNNQPFTVRVVCTQLCAIGTLLQIFSAGSLPWTIHGNTASLPSAESRDLILILSQNHSDSEDTIKMVANSVNAYRARYIVAYLSYVNNFNIKALASIAWTLRLLHVVVVRLYDRSVFATMPECKLPRVVQVGSVKWPNLRSLDLTNCTLRVAVWSVAPLFIAKSDDEIDGIWKEFFRFNQLALHFNASIVPINFSDISNVILTGYVDMVFTGIIWTPNYELGIVGVLSSDVGWCVPRTCKARDSSNLLWQEFPVVVWILLVTALLAISVTVRLLAPAPQKSLGDAIMRMIAVMAGTGVRLPLGHARWPLTGWLMAIVVLGSCYQNVLHSVMTAPVFVKKIEDIEDIMNSRMGVACISSFTCGIYEEQEKTAIESALEKRMEKVRDMEIGLRLFGTRADTSILCSSIVCDAYFTHLRRLPDYKIAPVLFSLFGVPPWSWLVPALRRISSQAEAAGLAGLWTFRSGAQTTCSNTVKDSQPLGLNVFWPALLLMCIGFTLATTAFVCEILWFQRYPAPKKLKRSH